MDNRPAQHYIDWALRSLGYSETIDQLRDPDLTNVLWAAAVKQDHEASFAPLPVAHEYHDPTKWCGCPVDSDCIHDSVLVQ